MEKKYILPLIISIFIILFPLIPFFVITGGTGFTNLFPGGFGSQMAFVMWSAIISAIIGILLGFFVAPIYLFLHRIILGRNRTYYIEDRPKFEEFRRRNFYGIFKAFFPALLVLSIAFVLAENPLLQELIVNQNFNPAPTDTAEMIALANRIQAFFIISCIGLGIPMALFSGAWILLDTGIVSKNKSRIEDSHEPVEVVAVGHTFISLFQGYAGISFVITLYVYVSEVIIATGGGAHFSIYGLIFIPLIFVLWAVPAMLIMDVTWNRRKTFILNRALKMGAVVISDIEIK